jgi:hypothetical protein
VKTELFLRSVPFPRGTTTLTNSPGDSEWGLALSSVSRGGNLEVPRDICGSVGLGLPLIRKAPRPFLISGPASQSIPSWNQIMEWLREVQRIREIAGGVAA